VHSSFRYPFLFLSSPTKFVFQGSFRSHLGFLISIVSRLFRIWALCELTVMSDSIVNASVPNVAKDLGKKKRVICVILV